MTFNNINKVAKERLVKSASQANYNASLGSMIQVGNLADNFNLLEETNRIGAYYYVLIINTMLQYGFNIAQVDDLTGTMMGRPRDATFRTIDIVGLDIFTHVVGNVIASIDDTKEKREFEIPNIVFELINKGSLGNKTGQGFYKKVKTEKEIRTLCWDFETGKYVTDERGERPSAAAYWDYETGKYVAAKRRELPTVAAARKAKNLKDKLQILVYGTEMDSEFAWEITKKWLLYTASKVPEIGDDYKAIDRAMRWGFNFDIGPFALWDAIGLRKSVARMREEGEVIPKWIEDRLAKGQHKFYETDTDEVLSILLASSENKKIFGNTGERCKSIQF